MYQCLLGGSGVVLFPGYGDFLEHVVMRKFKGKCFLKRADFYGASFFNQDSLRPHEKRALNFLVNEYLLKNGYRMTSVTFSDENADQVWIPAVKQSIKLMLLYNYVN